MNNLTKKMQKLVDEAPEARAFSPLNFGKLTVTPYVLGWKTDEQGKRMPDRKELTEDYELADGENFELLFTVDIAEFNPALQFKYERSVVIRKSRTPGEGEAAKPTDKTDWSEIIEPSLIATFGENYLDAIMASPYVCIEEVPNVQGRKSKPKEEGKEAKVLGVPKFVAAYKTRAECQTAREAVFGKSAEATPSDEIPDEIITKVRGLLKSVKGDANKIKPILQRTAPYNSYDADLLLGLAQA